MAIVAKVQNGIIDSSVSTDKVNAAQTNEMLGKSELGYDQFLQLLCAEMQYQDPLEPTSNTDYVAQMATFSQLEATLSMQDTLENSSDTTIKSMANDLVGKEVVVVDEDSETGFTDGIVDYVMYENGETYLSINNKLYTVDKLDTISTEEYYEAVVSAKTLSNMIAGLPDVDGLTTSYKTAVEQIRDMYDGLTEYQQKYVNSSDLAKLKSYESKLEELIKQEAENEEASDDVIDEADADKEIETEVE